MAFSYNDGDDIENEILDLLRQASDLGADRDLSSEAKVQSWPTRYHLSSVRPNLLRHLSFDGLDVLELGAGMGAVSRYLAEAANHLTIVEGSGRRLRAARQRLRDLENWQAHDSRIEDFAAPRRFDVVTLIGVLEYAELYGDSAHTGPGDAFDRMLRCAASHLKPGGVLLVAIENRFGIKYWSGVGEDHTGGLFDGIAGYPVGPSVRTFDLATLEGRIRAAGLGVERRYLPFPDYKMPSCVIDDRLVALDHDLVVDLACFRSFEDPLQPRARLFPDYLALHGLARAGLFSQFANSFLLAASADPASPILAHMNACSADEQELAWHYSPDRRIPCRTVIRQAAAGLWADKQQQTAPEEALAAPTAPGDSTGVRWQASPRQPVVAGERLRHRLLRLLYFGDFAAYCAELERFMRWAMEQHSGSAEKLTGGAVDTLWTNATLKGEEFVVFDDEWSLDEGVEASWFVLRNVLAAASDIAVAGTPEVIRLADLYEDFCQRLGLTADLEADLGREASLQGAVRRTSERDLEVALQQIASQQLSGRPPRQPNDLLRWQQQIEDLARQIDDLQTNNEKLRARNEHLDSAYAALESNHSNLHAHHHQLTTSGEGLSRLEASVSELHRSVAYQAETLVRQEQQLAKTWQDLQQRDTELHQKVVELGLTKQALETEKHKAIDSEYRIQVLLDQVRQIEVAEQQSTLALQQARVQQAELRTTLDLERAERIEVDVELGELRRQSALAFDAYRQALTVLNSRRHRWIEVCTRVFRRWTGGEDTPPSPSVDQDESANLEGNPSTGVMPQPAERAQSTLGAPATAKTTTSQATAASAAELQPAVRSRSSADG